MARRFIAILLILAALPLLAAGCSSKVDADPFAIALPDLDGRTVRVADYRGQVAMLNFWATWCPPCQAEIPFFVELQAQYGPSGFTIIGISLDQAEADTVRNFSLEKGINYPVLYAGDRGPDVVDRMGGFRGIPTTFLLDREGRVAKKVSGLAEKAFWEKELKKLL
jgi:thiol-disulfide isomerase/thioredoxin